MNSNCFACTAVRRSLTLALGACWLALAACGAHPALAGDWTHWRGPEQNGVSRELNLVDDWNPETRENVLWESPIGGRATPIVLDGKVYLNCRTTHDVNDPETKIHAQEQVVCWDAATGDVLWRDVFNVFQTDIPAPRVGWASMAGDAETGSVYVHTVSGLFICYDAVSGERKWEYSLKEEYGIVSGYGGRTQTPIVDEDRVIVSFMAKNWGPETGMPPPRQRFYAFDKDSGDLLWTSAPGGAPKDTNYSVPLIAVIDGVRQLIAGNSDGGAYGINARTGEKLWGFRMSARGLNASPVVDGHLVYISHGEDNIDSPEFGRVQCIDARGRGDLTETHSVWRQDGVKAGYTGLLVKDGILYVVADTGVMFAYDSATGDPLWQHNLGTVGKGSPVWADGKIYVMEVNANIHVLKPSREGCETISHVELAAGDGQGLDEIYASPAISDGRIFLVTRDRTICLANSSAEVASDPVPSLAQEHAPAGPAVLAHLIPQEVCVSPGDEVDYRLRLYDANGRFLEEVAPTLALGEGLSQVEVAGAHLHAPALDGDEAGLVVARHGDLEATARVRAFPDLPWSWDFAGLTGRQAPPGWINAMVTMQPRELEGEAVMYSSVPFGKRPSRYVTFGPAEMSGYTIQADVLLKEQRRRLSSVGVTCQRYNLILKGNTGKLSIQSWPPHLRMAKEISFFADPDVWYTMKLRVDLHSDGAHVLGKIWPRGESEPAEWTIEAVDPHPNETGSPGVYYYEMAESYVDNVHVYATQ